MSIFKKLFSSSSKSGSSKKSRIPDDRSSSYRPEKNIPIDELFMINFKKNGGKFLYCDSFSEVLEAFDNILLENDWYEKNVCCFDENLSKKFNNFNLAYEKSGTASFFFLTCEYLVADNGAILISSNQIKEKKLTELPDNFVVLASTSQITKDIGAGLRGIKEKNRQAIPSNITTIKNFETQKEADFLNYGSTTKNLYLLLFEDL